MYQSLALLFTLLLVICHAWSPFSWGGAGCGGGGNRHGSCRPGHMGGDQDDFSNRLHMSGGNGAAAAAVVLILTNADNDSRSSYCESSITPTSNDDDEDNVESTDTSQVRNGMDVVQVRGGAAPNNPVIKGSKNTLSATASYWSGAWNSATSSITQSIQGLSQTIADQFKSDEQKQQEALLEQLQSTPVKAVTAPNSTVLPPDVLAMAAKRSGMIGRPLRVESVQEMARQLKQWYTRKGYVLHSVTGATLQADSATAELAVEEPTLSDMPVGITFLKEMVVEQDGTLLTYRQYREKHSQRRTLGHDKIQKADLNTTFVPIPTGLTNPNRIAKALQMKPGNPFHWDSNRWQAIVGSGIFSRILKASPQRMRDGTVQLHILATEPPPRNMEYGISNSFYTGSWEGEVSFQYSNLLGGGESFISEVRRGTKDAEPSIKFRYSDDKFGMEGGYDVEVFSDFIGETGSGQVEEDPAPTLSVDDNDHLLHRRGASFRLRNPVDPNKIRHSSLSACLERTSTLTGHREGIGSATVSVGPFQKELPLDARSNVLASLTSGTRIAEKTGVADEGTKHNPIGSYNILPYSMASATTRQIFPLATITERRRPITLALQHVVATSTPNLPRHEANALGIAARVRGYPSSDNGRIASSLLGTTEIRIPVTLPTDKLTQDTNVILFGDWLLAQKDLHSPFFRKSSVGIGIRKTIQGIPLKYDLSYTQDGKLRSLFGLGRDFDV